MKNYLAFYGMDYYPEGGMEDFIGDFDTLEEAKNFIYDKHNKEGNTSWDCLWCQIYSLSDRNYVYDRYRDNENVFKRL